MSSVERRRYPRLAFNVNVEYKILGRADKETPGSHSKNISAAGICIILLERVEVGTKLELKFIMPDLNKNIIAQGKIVWIEEFIVGDEKTGRNYEVGIEFTKIDDEDKEIIKEFVMDKIIRRIGDTPNLHHS